MLASLRFIPATPIIAYASIFISSSLLYLFICRDLLKEGLDAKGLLPVLLLLILVRLSFLGMRPVGSDDVYRYIWDGRVQSAGINPYRYAPDDTALTDLRTPELPTLVNHANLRTLYFPLSEWVFYLSNELSGEHIWGIQMFIVLAEVLTIIGLLKLMREFLWSPWRVLLYAANPLVILQFSLDAHVDVLGFPFLVFGIFLYLRKRLTASLLLIGLSLLIKPTALVLLPILFLDQRTTVARAKTLLIPVATMLIPFIPYAINVNPFDALTTFTEHWYFNGALFSLLFPVFPDNQTNRLWCFVILIVVLLLLYASRRPLIQKLLLSMLLLLLCSPVAHLWYIGWLIVLLPLAPLASGIMLAATASLPSITFVTYQMLGIWKDYPLVLILEYLPVVALLYFDLRKKTESVPATKM